MLSPTGPRRIPCQERGERRVAELIGAAESVIAEAGYEGATMCAIAERAGASIGSLYQFFPGKPAITQALRSHYVEQFDQMCAPLAEQARTLNLETFVSHLIDLTVLFVDSHPAFLALLDAPRSTRTSPAIRNLLRERFAGFFLARKPRMSKAKALQLATVTLHIMKALNQLYTELSSDQRRTFIREFKVVLFSYLSARIEPRCTAGRAGQ
jgi:AcrR family transcriptional regulator